LRAGQHCDYSYDGRENADSFITDRYGITTESGFSMKLNANTTAREYIDQYRAEKEARKVVRKLQLVSYTHANEMRAVRALRNASAA
jgi:hypothetical protein